MNSLELIAATAFGLESVAAEELRRLGYRNKILGNGRVLFRAEAGAICRANLWLRTADRVLLRLATFAATDFGQLFDGTAAVAWEDWLPADAAFPVNGRSVRSQLSSVPACQKIVKKAIVERLKKAHCVEQLDESGPKFTLEVALLENQVSLTVDTTGPGLNKRGYRKLLGEAQLKETLAAGLILLSDWLDEDGRSGSRETSDFGILTNSTTSSFSRTDCLPRPLLDPFCGTGTIPIEAAMIARNMAPGRGREFAAEAWPTLAAELWRAAREEAADLARPTVGVPILGRDLDEAVLSLARYHARQAGVSADVEFQQQDFRKGGLDRRLWLRERANIRGAKDDGTIVCNPPYGERMGSESDVAELYQTMSRVFAEMPHWSVNVLTSHPRFEKLVGCTADANRKLYNGQIECRYYQFAAGAFGAPKPCATASVLRSSVHNHALLRSTEAVARPLGNGTEDEQERPGNLTQEVNRSPKVLSLVERETKTVEQGELFGTRLIKRAHHLRRWAKRGIECYRLYDRDIPEIPLAVDRYGDRLHLIENERPHARTPAQHTAWLDRMSRVAGEVLDVPAQRVFLKRRDPGTGALVPPRAQGAEHLFEVHELGLKYRVNLADFVNTGLLLDRREIRTLVRELAAPIEVALASADAMEKRRQKSTLQKTARGKRVLDLFAYTGAFTVCAAAGGAATTTSVDWFDSHLRWAQDNLELNELANSQQRFVTADPLDFVRTHLPGEFYDLAIVDAPGELRDWDLQRDHLELLTRLLALMSAGGIVLLIASSRRFKLFHEQLAGAQVREVTRQTIPDDFRNERIHRCWRIVRTATLQ